MTGKLTMPDGTKIAYDVHGEGFPIILIHGVTDCKETYDNELPWLTPHFKVYRYDLRGHGLSDHPKTQYNLDDHLNDAQEVIKQLGLTEFALYGGSLGSYVAGGTACQMPEKVKALILNVGAARNPSSGLANSVKNSTLPTDLAERRRFWIRRLIHDQKSFDYIDQSGFQKVILTPEDEQLVLKSITAFDFREGFKNVTCPTLITSGTYDPVNPPAKGKELQAAIPNAIYHEFAGSHLLRFEFHKEYEKVTLDFLKKALKA